MNETPLMTKQKIIAFASTVFFATTVLAETTPVMVSLWDTVQFPSREYDVAGIGLSPLYGRCRDFTGLDVGLCHRRDGDFTGIGIGAINLHSLDCLSAIKSNACARVNQLSGAQIGGVLNIAGDVFGTQIVLYGGNFGFDVYGAQICGGGLLCTGAGPWGCNIAKHVHGMQIGADSCNLTRTMDGVQIAGVANFAGEFCGAQIGGLGNVASEKFSKNVFGPFANEWQRTTSGVQIGGLFNVAERMNGMQIGGGFCNYSKHLCGTQIGGLFNLATNMNGVQIGIFNYAETMEHGLQIGFWNQIDNNGWAPLLPFVNGSF